MQSAKTVTVELAGAQIQIPERVVVQNWLQGLAAQPATFAAADTTTPPPIGQHWAGQGGIYAGMIRGQNGQPDYHLIVAHGDTGEATDIAWGKAGEEIEGADDDRDGLLNTLALLGAQHDCPAAKWASKLKLEGFEDWYLPARCELMLSYTNAPEPFHKSWHWSSTQYSAHNAWGQTFGVGDQYYVLKYDQGRARAVRRFISHSSI